MKQINSNKTTKDHKPMSEIEERLMAQYGENRQIADGNYDPSLAVKCINGTLPLRMEKR